MEIYLIRHTTPEIAPGICYGQTDLELATGFESELIAIKEKLPAQFDRVYSSPLGRCKRLAESLEGEMVIDDRLMEMDFGAWEMKAWDDMPQEELNPWMTDFVMTPVPKGESFQQLINRSQNIIREIEASESERVAIVTHAGVIRALLGYFLGLASENVFRLNIDYGGISLVSAKSGRYHVKYVNR